MRPPDRDAPPAAPGWQSPPPLRRRLGLGVVAPLCFATAGELNPAVAAAVIARLTIVNCVGAALGGVLVGAIRVGGTLRIGFDVPAALAVVVVLLAPGFATRVRGAVAVPA